MSNAAKLAIPTTGDGGKAPYYDESGDEWDLAFPMVVVNHGSTAGTARPVGAAAVYWIGSVTPSNAAAHDLWYDTA